MALLSLPLALAPGVAAATTSVFVLRVGDGATALGSSATASFLEERSIADGSLIRTIPLPTTPSGPNAALTLSGSATSEGNLSRSLDGQYIVLAGYDALPGTASVTTSGSALVNRVIGRVDVNGNIDTTTRLNDAANAGSPRSAVSTDGTSFWMAGSTGGARYAPLGGTTSTQVSPTVTNLRVLTIGPGLGATPPPHQLYTSTASGAFRIGTVGTGLPTFAGNSIDAVFGLPTTGSPVGFVFLDTDGVNGADTLYIADDGATGGDRLQKWHFDGFSFALQYALNGPLTGGLRGLAADVDGSGNPVLVATTAETPTRVVKLVDTGPQSLWTPLAVAGANTAFRGVALAPGSPGGPGPSPSPSPSASASASPSASPVDNGTVDAQVTVPAAAAACLELSTPSVSFGTLPLGSVDQPGNPPITVTNCSTADGTIYAHGTDATTPGVVWSLVDNAVAGSCADTALGLNAYRLRLAGPASPVELSTTNKSLGSVSAGGGTVQTARIDTACPGSGGAGSTMSLQIVFLATVGG